MSQTLLILQGITKTFADRTILHDVTLQVQTLDRIGIVGPNGVGKSTLLNVISGSVSPDSGLVNWAKRGCTRYYLTQSRQESLQPENELEELFLLSKRLGLPADLAESDSESSRLRGASGGERTKLAIAKALSTHAELLILDEPTNHLDAEGIDWLIERIRRYPGTVIVVSHDRYFLDQTVHQIVELRDGRARLYSGNYSFYAAERERDRQAQLQRYEIQKREQQRLETNISQVKEWAERSHRQAGKQGTLSERRQLGYKQYHRAKAKKLDRRVKSQIQRLESLRLESIARPKETDTVHFEVGAASRHGRSLIEASGLCKRFGDYILFTKSNFYVQRGEKVGLSGANGCGKTTLLKIIMGEEPITDGRLWVSPTAKVAYLSQNNDSPVPGSALDMAQELSAQQRTKFRTILANMELDEAKLVTPIAKLSLGEQTRLKLAWLILNDHNLLILDEPTNHLDLTSREELERALESYQGTLLVVSHDRYLMERLCDKFLVFSNHRVTRYDRGLNCHGQTPVDDSARKMYEEKQRSDELMILETRIAQLLGDLSRVTPKHTQYEVLNSELNALMKRRHQIRTEKEQNDGR